MSSTAATTTPFKPSLQLQTKKPTARSFADSLPSATSDAAEARYWAEKFGLGSSGSGKQPQFAHPRRARLQAGSAAIVHQCLFHERTLAVVCGPRVKLYGTTPQSTFHRTLARHSQPDTVPVIEHDRQVQTGGRLAVAAAYRGDGRLLAIGTDGGELRIADATSRATLCTLSSDTRLAVRALAWFRNGQHLISAGDDGRLRVWDLQTGALSSSSSSILTLSGHGDAIRSAVLWQDSAKRPSWPYRTLAATGSYDHSVRIWNLDNLPDETLDRCVAILPHGGPVEALLLLPSSNPDVPVWLLSAGGTVITVWNPLTGCCVADVAAQHRKSITSLLAMPRTHGDDGTVSMRVVTGGLDGLLRIHSFDSAEGKLSVIHGIRLTTGITALAATTEGDRLAIGTIDGTVDVRQRGPSLTAHKRKRDPKAGTYAFFTRGMNADAIAGDFIVSSSSKKRKLKSFDLCLKQFRYGDALDEALETRIPQAVVAVLEELGKRRGLTIALSNRDEESLEPILSFTVRYICRPRFSSLLIGVANKLIDIYGDVSGQSETIDELFDKLKNQVLAESKTQRKLLHCMGEIEALIASVAAEDE